MEIKFLNKTQVANKIREDEFSIGSSFYAELDKEVESLIERAMDRAKKNDRRTIMSRDV